MNQPRTGIAVLAGGTSPEREISLASGICVAAALAEGGYDVQTFDPGDVPIESIDWSQFAACFIALHGGDGEDGHVQDSLNKLKVRYTGSGPLASRRAMSKSMAKERFLADGVLTPRWTTMSADEPIGTMLATAKQFGYPLVVKPDGQGSSLGVHLTRSDNDLQRAVADCQFYGELLLLEHYIRGREFTVAVVDREPLPILEIILADAIFDYQQKYEIRAEDHAVSPSLPREMREKIAAVAVAACEALGTAGLVRVDLRMDDQNRIFVLEVNTVPGLTEQSLAPHAARLAGWDMPKLCDALVRRCLPAGVV